jgi:hypothetical protein
MLVSIKAMAMTRAGSNRMYEDQCWLHVRMAQAVTENV